MKELKWIHNNHQWIAKYRNRFTGNNNKFIIRKSNDSYGYVLIWDAPTVHESINTFRQLKNAKIVANLITFG